MTGMFADEDERFAAFVRSAVVELGTPPTPREEIWAGVMAQRQGRGHLSVVEGTAHAHVELSRRKNRSLSIGRLTVPVQWAVPTAALVLIVGISIGVTIGRHAMQPASASVAQGSQGVLPRVPKGFPSQIETEQHFHDVQQLLTSFSVANSHGHHVAQIDSKTEARAHNLLSTTQLLLYSPMAMDPATPAPIDRSGVGPLSNRPDGAERVARRSGFDPTVY